MLADKDKIFTNLYSRESFGLDAAQAQRLGQNCRFYQSEGTEVMDDQEAKRWEEESKNGFFSYAKRRGLLFGIIFGSITPLIILRNENIGIFGLLFCLMGSAGIILLVGFMAWKIDGNRYKKYLEKKNDTRR